MDSKWVSERPTKPGVYLFREKDSVTHTTFLGIIKSIESELCEVYAFGWNKPLSLRIWDTYLWYEVPEDMWQFFRQMYQAKTGQKHSFVYT